MCALMWILLTVAGVLMIVAGVLLWQLGQWVRAPHEVRVAIQRRERTMNILRSVEHKKRKGDEHGRTGER